jgi:phospholipid-binding lipoprotein MlaA
MKKKYALVILLFFIIIAKQVNLSANAKIIKYTDEKSPDYSGEFVGKDRLYYFNKSMFVLDRQLNKYVIYPVNYVWAGIMPKYGQERINNVFKNADYPKRFIGSLFQGEFKSSGTETLRFLTNTTLGLGGLYDPAKGWFGLEEGNENISQAFAKWGIGSGYYLYLPVAGPMDMRSLFARAAEFPLNPEIYFPSTVAYSVSGGRNFKDTTNFVDVVKYINQTYADPYEEIKILYGLTSYVRNNNLDKEKEYNKKEATVNNKQAYQTISMSNTNNSVDVLLENYNSQGAAVDSLRSMNFDRQNDEKSGWMQISPWNRTFVNRFKESSIRLTEGKPKYEYRYILQKEKNSKLAIIYPSIGENIRSAQGTAIAKLLYENGYSVVIVSSSFDWKLARSLAYGYRPGFAPEDSSRLRTITSKIINKITKDSSREFSRRILVGTSLGAMHTLFAASQEEKENLLGISEYICISPPVDLLGSVLQLDKFLVNWKKFDNKDVRLRTALTYQKTVNNCTDKQEDSETLNYSEDEAKFLASFNIKEKISDLIMTIEKDSKFSNQQLHKMIIKMGFYDYFDKYLLSTADQNIETLRYKSNLHSIENFLKNSKNIRIFSAQDDVIVNKNDLKWLKNVMNDRMTLYSNGSHQGYLYRSEFQEAFIKAVNDDI